MMLTLMKQQEKLRALHPINISLRAALCETSLTLLPFPLLPSLLLAPEAFPPIALLLKEGQNMLLQAELPDSGYYAA